MHNRVLECLVGLSAEGSLQTLTSVRTFYDISGMCYLAKQKFKADDAQRPPVNRTAIATLGKYFWSHVCHGARDGCQRLGFDKLNSNVEIRQMRMPLFVQ